MPRFFLNVETHQENPVKSAEMRTIPIYLPTYAITEESWNEPVKLTEMLSRTAANLRQTACKLRPTDWSQYLNV